MEDGGLLTLSEDDREVLAGKLKDGAFALATLRECLKKSLTVDVELVRTTLKVAEHTIADVSGTTGAALDTQEDVEQRSRDLRRLNMRVRELESQIGAGASPEVLRHGLGSVGKKFKTWWKQEGFGHVAELAFSEYGQLSATLSCHLFGRHSYSMSATPVSDREKHRLWLESLDARGFDLVSESDAGREIEIRDTDRSRAAVAALVSKAFPSAKIVETRSHLVYGTTKHALRDVDVTIYDLADVLALPEDSEDNND